MSRADELDLLDDVANALANYSLYQKRADPIGHGLTMQLRDRFRQFREGTNGRNCCHDNRTLRRVIVLLCLLGLGLIAYGFLHNAFLSAATAMWVGSSWGDLIA